jgi:HSP20 family protein
MLRSRFATPSMFEPWGELRREIDRLFDAAITGTPFGGQAFGDDMRWSPAMDVEETEDRIRLTFEVPGVKQEDLNVSVEHDTLTVSGEKRYEREEGDGKERGRFVERRYGRFERSVTLPDSVVAEHVTAHFENGVLTIELPKTETSRRRSIRIGGGTEQKRLGSAKAEKGERSSRSEKHEERPVA